MVQVVVQQVYVVVVPAMTRVIVVWIVIVEPMLFVTTAYVNVLQAMLTVIMTGAMVVK